MQVAATFANHVLPGGSGGLAVNVRFLRRYGLSRGDAVGAVALNMLAGRVTHTALLLVALVAAPDVLTAALGHGGAQRLVGHRHSWRWPRCWRSRSRGSSPGPSGAGRARAVRHVRAQLAVLSAVVRTRAGRPSCGSARSRCRCCTA